MALRALVIDDSTAMRRIIGRIVGQLGFEVHEASDGQEALDRLAQIGRADVALVDWNMPRMNGFEFVQAVRRETVHDGMKLLMVTSETEMGQVALALEAGADEYMMKPFTKEALLEKLALIGVQP